MARSKSGSVVVVPAKKRCADAIAAPALPSIAASKSSGRESSTLLLSPAPVHAAHVLGSCAMLRFYHQCSRPVHDNKQLRARRGEFGAQEFQPGGETRCVNDFRVYGTIQACPHGRCTHIKTKVQLECGSDFRNTPLPGNSPDGLQNQAGKREDISLHFTLSYAMLASAGFTEMPIIKSSFT